MRKFILILFACSTLTLFSACSDHGHDHDNGDGHSHDEPTHHDTIN